MSEIAIKYLIKLEVLNKTKIIFEEFFVKKSRNFYDKICTNFTVKKISQFFLIN